MRATASEKREIIRLVEGSELSVSRTLQELDVPRSTFYHWYKAYQEGGHEALEPAATPRSRGWVPFMNGWDDEQLFGPSRRSTGQGLGAIHRCSCNLENAPLGDRAGALVAWPVHVATHENRS